MKTSLAPGSRVVIDYLERAGLLEPLDELGFYLAGYGCTTCIGNSGPLLEGVSEAVADGGLSVAAVLSGNRNFESRIHPDVRQNYLASPPLVVAYALAGTVDVDLTTEPLGTGADGADVFLRDLWPSDAEVADAVRASLHARAVHRALRRGLQRRRALGRASRRRAARRSRGTTSSTYVLQPAVLRRHHQRRRRRSWTSAVHACSAVLGDSVTTDHISPAGAIRPTVPAGRVPRSSAGSRRAGLQHLRHAARQPRGDGARHVREPAHQEPARARHRGRRDEGVPRRRARRPSSTRPEAYRAAGTPLLVVAGEGVRDRVEPRLGGQGHRCCSASAPCSPSSYERIHRSNLIGMGIAALQFQPGESLAHLGLDGTEPTTSSASRRSTTVRSRRP